VKHITHIPRESAKHRLILSLLMLLMALAGAFRVSGQSGLPDTVCAGVTKPYWVTYTPGSAYNWLLDGVPQIPTITTDTVFITWSTTGDFLLTVQEITAENCPGTVRSLQVHVKNDPPAFVPPLLAPGYCMEDITTAVYNPGGTYYVNDLVPPRPDYYLLAEGSTLLDITGISDDCPGALTISWVIDFAGALPPDLVGTGQISASIPPGGIQFPLGNNVITYTLTDAAGSSTVHSVTLVVLPRPEIGDIPP